MKMTTALARVVWVLGSLAVPAIGAASPIATPAGTNYSLNAVTFGVGASASDVSQIVQLGFRPGDSSHLYATRSTGTITRYDYSASGAAATLSNATDIVSGISNPYGLAFDGDDLYFTLNPFVSGRSTGQIDRVHLDGSGNAISSPQVITAGITNGNQHGTDQLAIYNHSLYVGIGINGQWRSDASSPATLYGGGYDVAWNGSIGHIADLTQITDATPVDTLDASSYASADSSKLRLYATGFRNPFGIRTDASGHVYVSDNGSDQETASNSTAGLNRPATDDLFYKNVNQNAVGVFPTTVGNTGLPGSAATLQPFAHAGLHTSVTGFDFINQGPDAGKMLLARYGSAFDTNVGYDLVLVGPTAAGATLDNTSSDDTTTIFKGFGGATDVLSDPTGRFLISDRGTGTIYVLSVVPEPGTFGVALLALSWLPLRRNRAKSAPH